MVKKYECLLCKAGGSTMSQDSYSLLFHMINEGETADDEEKLMLSVKHFANHIIKTDTKVSLMQAEINKLKAEIASLTVGALLQHPLTYVYVTPPPGSVLYANTRCAPA